MGEQGQRMPQSVLRAAGGAVYTRESLCRDEM